MAGDFGGEPALDFDDFLKNLDVDLFGGGRWRGEDEEPFKVAEEEEWGRAVESGGDCGESVSFWGNRMRKKKMNKHDLGGI